jgi:hypothetical protein
MITKITENLYIGDHDDVVNHNTDELNQLRLPTNNRNS